MARKAKKPAVETMVVADTETKSRGRPAYILCRVLLPNLWTSKGKVFKGAEVSLPPDEADVLDLADKIKKVR